MAFRNLTAFAAVESAGASGDVTLSIEATPARGLVILAATIPAAR
jgi:hypothetical protein